ncbi:S-layer homology domain-containing protein [Evansella sp. AB-rgal1]|uniref:S-layer homology domain-containing protein n=1 Tax=Evansella sp. AB-rgal1 TaxID=3242696 RepID=UPI00359D903B
MIGNRFSIQLRKFTAAFLIFLLVFADATLMIAAANTGDGQPPTVDSVEVSPKEVRVGDVITIDAKVFDDLSGVKEVFINFTSPSGQQSFGVYLHYNSEKETWSNTYRTKEYEEEGQWKFRSIKATDHAGNSKIYEARDYAEVGFYLENPNYDATPPNVEWMNVTPANAKPGEEVMIEMKVTDDRSGVDTVTAYFYTPSRNRSVSSHLKLEEDGIWRGVYHVKQFDGEGEWQLNFVHAVDKARNQKYFYKDHFATGNSTTSFFVTNEYADISHPIVEAITIAPQEVPVGQRVSVMAHVTDDVSGVKTAQAVFESPSKNRTQHFHLEWNEATNLWEGNYTAKELDEHGEWNLWYIHVNDYAGNSRNIIYRGQEGYSYTIVPKDTNSIEPLPHAFTTVNETWSQRYIDGDLYIGPNSVLTINGDVRINGNVYVYGAIQNYGNLTITGTLHARNIHYGTQSTLYNGTVLILGGTNNIGSMRVTNTMWDVPVTFTEELVLKNGNLTIKGATIPGIDLYIEGRKVDIQENGTFQLELTNFSREQIAYRVVDVFGHQKIRHESIRHYGAPVWPEGSEITLDYLDETSITFRWPEAHEENGVVSYYIYRNDGFFEYLDSNQTTHHSTELDSDMLYQYSVYAIGYNHQQSEELFFEARTERSLEQKYRDIAIRDAITSISELPPVHQITLNDKEAVESARQLVTEAMEYGIDRWAIHNINVLITIETKIEDLERIEYWKQTAIHSAIQSIYDLPSIEEVTFADKQQIVSSRFIVYDALDAGAKQSDITNLGNLELLEAKIIELEKAMEAMIAIDALPYKEDVALGDKVAVEATRVLVWEALELGATEEDISNLGKLMDVEVRITELEEARTAKLLAIEQANNAINNLFMIQVLALTDKELLETARAFVTEAFYLGATDDEIPYLEVLEDYELIMRELEEAEIAKLAAIESAIMAIDNLPALDELIMGDHVDIEATRGLVLQAIELGASEEQITNLGKLEDVEWRMEELKRIATVTQLATEEIANLPEIEDITLNDKAKIEAARKLVVQAFAIGATEILNLPYLVAAEQRILDLEEKRTAVERAIVAIDSLPQLQHISLEHRTVLEDARKLVTRALQVGASKDAIINLGKLELAELKLADLELAEAAKHAAINEISSLPLLEDLTLEDIEKVVAVRHLVEEAYYLGVVEEEISNLTVLDVLEKKIVELERAEKERLAKQVAMEEAIAAIDILTPFLEETITPSYVEAARELVTKAYDLGVTKEEITNLVLLEAVEQRIIELREREIAKFEAIQKAIDAISSLPIADELTLEYRDLLEVAKKLVQQAFDLGATYVDIMNADHLEKVELRMAELEEEELKRLEKAKTAEAAIANLPSIEVITVEDKELVEAVRNVVKEALQVGATITNLFELEALESRIKELEEAKQARENAVRNAMTMIDGIATIEKVTLQDKATVVVAREAVSRALEVGATEMEILNLDKLLTWEAQIKAMEDSIVTLVTLKDLPIINTTVLTDINTHWAKTNVEGLARKGILRGYPDATFKPDQNISRAEVMTVISRILTNFPKTDDVEWTFHDDAQVWAKDVILGGVSLGLIQGNTRNEFRANDPITRTELAIILNRLDKIVNFRENRDRVNDVGFNDTIPVWARESIVNMSESGIINGYKDGTFRPNANATRAEVVTVISRILE